MTGGTTANDTGVIIPGAGKSRGVMTNRAIISGRQMGSRFDGRSRYAAIVTGSTVIDNTLVTEYRSFKTTWHVTNTAVLGSWYVTSILLGHCSRCTITMA